jgi:hypothetical protein
VVAIVKRLLAGPLVLVMVALAGCSAPKESPHRLGANHNPVSEAEVKAALPAEAVSKGSAHKTTGESIGAESVETAGIKAGAVTEAKVTQGASGKFVPTGGSAGEFLQRKGTTELQWGNALLAAEETKTVTTGTTELSLSSHNVFVLTIEHATEIKLKEAPAHPVEVLIFFKENSTGGYAVTFAGVKWVGSEPTFSTTANTENLVTMVVRAGKATEPYGIGGLEGKEGPKGTTGSTGPEGKEGKAPNTITEETWAISGAVKSGETFPGFFVKNASGETEKLAGVEYAIQKGTSATVKVYHRPSGESAKAVKWTGAVETLVAKETQAEKAPESSLELHAKEYVYPEVTAESGTPEGLSVTVFVEHIG